jgi:hypothetical protein
MVVATLLTGRTLWADRNRRRRRMFFPRASIERTLPQSDYLFPKFPKLFVSLIQSWHQSLLLYRRLTTLYPHRHLLYIAKGT